VEIAIDDWLNRNAHRQIAIANRDSDNREFPNAAIDDGMTQSHNRQIVNKSSIVNPQSSMD
jgi:hypothetical protein